MKQILKMTTCLLLTVLCVMQPVSAIEASSNAVLAYQPSTSEILCAVEPLVEAQAEYYNISKISVDHVMTTVDSSGAIETTCDVVFTMTLKAESAEELPHVAGMLSELGMETVMECLDTVSKSNVAATTMSTTQRLTYAIQAQSVSQIQAYAEYIGKESIVSFSVLLRSDASRNITEVKGLGGTDYSGARVELPLSALFPQTEAEMFRNGVAAVQGIAMQVCSVNLTPGIEQYDRIAARDYAMRWSSDATWGMTCEHDKHYIDDTKYNPSYTKYCHADCANYVSQALYAGGVPTDSTWYPGASAWIAVQPLWEYMYEDMGYWLTSSYANCNAGGVIVNISSNGNRYHVNMCVLNDTVNRAYAAHTNDRRNTAYTDGYWPSGETEEYYIVSVIDSSSIMSAGEYAGR